jgi:hypothetical protein
MKGRLQKRVQYYDWSTYILLTWGVYVLLVWLHCFSWIYVGIIYAAVVAVLLKTRPIGDVFKFSFLYIIGVLLMIGYFTMSWMSYLYDAFWNIHSVRVATRMYRSVQMLFN